MPITHNLNLKTKPVGNQKLLIWDGVHNAHEYTIYKSGIAYLTVDSNRSLTLPDDAYLIYAKTWQNDESLKYSSIIANFDYTLQISYSYRDALNNTLNNDYYIVGKFKPRERKSFVRKVVDEDTIKFEYLVTLEVVSISTSNLVFRASPRVKVDTKLATNYKTRINITPVNLTINF